MKVYPFSLREHEEYGELGLVFKGSRPYFEPATSGFACAHDILEHPVTPHPDPIIDEYMALGAIIAGRVENNYVSEYGRVVSYEDISSDIFSLTQWCLSEDKDICLYPYGNTLRNSDLVSTMGGVIWSGLRSAVKEWTDLEGEKLEELLDEYDFQVTQIKGWMCKGYNLFRKRFARLDLHTVSTHLFDEISSACDEVIKNEIYEGKLLVDFSGYKVEVHSDY